MSKKGIDPCKVFCYLLKVKKKWFLDRLNFRPIYKLSKQGIKDRSYDPIQINIDCLYKQWENNHCMIFFPSKFRSSFRLQSKVMFYQFHAVKNSMNALILPSARSQEKAFIQKLIDSKIGDKSVVKWELFRLMLRQSWV